MRTYYVFTAEDKECNNGYQIQANTRKEAREMFKKAFGYTGPYVDAWTQEQYDKYLETKLRMG